MKKLLLTLSVFFCVQIILAQSPEKINYQAIARDLSGNPLENTAVNLTFDILQGSSSGSLVFTENQFKTTNQFGLFTVEIGAINTVDFPSVAWGSNTYYLRISVNGQAMPATPLLSVPYALYAKTSGNGLPQNTNDTSATNEIQFLSINGTNDSILLTNGGSAPLPVNNGLWNVNAQGIDYTGANVGIGTSTPGAKLEVVGAVKIIDGTEGVGKVLTSNAVGTASWQTPSLAPSGWGLTGDSGTVSNSNFVGTTDAVNLEFRTNNILRTRITQKGQLEILNTGNSVFIGENAGTNDDLTNNQNVFVGTHSGSQNTDGSSNTAVGFVSLTDNISGTNNTALGSYSLHDVTTGTSNTGIGSSALSSVLTSSYNTAVGAYALNAATTAENNTVVGFGVMNSNVSGGDNVVLGNSAYRNSTSGANNVVLGSYAGYNTLGSNNIFIGYRAGLSEAGGNKLYIESSSSLTPLIYGEFDTDLLRVNGTLEVNDPSLSGYAFPPLDGTVGQVPITDGAGNVTWQTPLITVSPWTQLGGSLSPTTITSQVGIGTIPYPNSRLSILSSSTLNYGINNQMDYTGASIAYGIYNLSSQSGTGDKHGLTNQMTLSTGANELKGIVNRIDHGGSGLIYGVDNLIIGTNGTGQQVGTRNLLQNNGTGLKEGTYNAVSSITGENQITGTRNDVNHDGTGFAYGVTATLSGSSTNKIGIAITGEDRNYFSNNVGIGIQYPTQLLHLFNGTLRIDDGVNPYNLPAAAGSAGDVLTMNGGNAVWQTPVLVPVSPWTDSGISIYATDFSKAIGIGTATPSAKLEVTTDILVNQITLGKGGGSIDKNTAIGVNTLLNNTTGDFNTANGYEALFSNTTGSHNTANGTYALRNCDGYENTAIGAYALSSNGSMHSNTAVGYQTLLSNTTGLYNTSLGNYGLRTNDSGNNNTSLGFSAGYSALGSNNVFIGYRAGLSEAGGNKLYIESSSSLTPLIYGEFDTDLIRVNGSLEVKGAVAKAIQFFNSGASVVLDETHSTIIFHASGSSDILEVELPDPSTCIGRIYHFTHVDPSIGALLNINAPVGVLIYLTDSNGKPTETFPNSIPSAIPVGCTLVANNTGWYAISSWVGNSASGGLPSVE